MNKSACGMAAGFVCLLAGLAVAGDPVVADGGLTTGVPKGMVVIPAGINSGKDPDFGAYALTNRTAFAMDATEVTKARWDDVRIWGATHGYTDLPAGGSKGTNHPVVTVSWYDCVKWCNARSEKEGRTPCYTDGGGICRTGGPSPTCTFTANGYRLPTNTEWEYAARGGVSGKRFPWGDTIDHTRANYKGNPSGNAYDQGYEGFDTRYATEGSPYTSPAGAFAANGYGLYDMAGNVWEWCWDASEVNRLHRGGCWSYDAGPARCGRRDYTFEGAENHILGFRAVCR